jgi:hypothetical protein
VLHHFNFASSLVEALVPLADSPHPPFVALACAALEFQLSGPARGV